MSEREREFNLVPGLFSPQVCPSPPPDHSSSNGNDNGSNRSNSSSTTLCTSWCCRRPTRFPPTSCSTTTTETSAPFPTFSQSKNIQIFKRFISYFRMQTVHRPVLRPVLRRLRDAVGGRGAGGRLGAAAMQGAAGKGEGGESQNSNLFKSIYLN